MAQDVVDIGWPLNAAATVSGATSAATRTLTAPTASRIRLRSIIIYASTSATATLTVTVNSVVVLDYGTLSLTVAGTVISDINLTALGGQNIIINIGAGSAGTTTTTSVAEYF
jgi:hypothetical protein